MGPKAYIPLQPKPFALGTALGWTPNATLLRHLTQNIPTCWYILVLPKARRTRSNFSQQFSAILEIEFDLVAKLVAKKNLREVAMCANVCNFRLSNFEQN